MATHEVSAATGNAIKKRNRVLLRDQCPSNAAIMQPSKQRIRLTMDDGVSDIIAILQFLFAAKADAAPRSTLGYMP